MKILLIGEYYSKNLGDPVLCQTVEHSILEAFPDAQIIPFDMSGKTGFDTYFEPLNYSSLQNWYFRFAYRAPFLLKHFPLYRVIQQDTNRYMRTMCMLDTVLKQEPFNLAIFAGGSIFMDYFAGIIYGIVRRLAKEKIPIIFHACGMSGLTEDAAYVLQKTLNFRNIKSIALRDSYSRFLDRFHVSACVTETFDTALACSRYFLSNQETIADIGIGVIWNPEYFVFQKALVHSVQQSGASWRIFTNGEYGDWKMAIRILNDLGIPESEQGQYLMARPENTEKCIQTVTGFHRIVSFRMHSQIVATSYGIPSFGFVWDDKVRCFYSKMGMAQNCTDIDKPVQWESIEQRLHMDGDKLRDLAVNAGYSSVRLLIQKINDVCKEVMI